MITGYIEGYYGRALTWEQRWDLIRRLAEGGGGVFLIASKEDPFHRQDWRKPYPKAWLQALQALSRRAKKIGVTVMPGMAPGLTYDYTSAADYATLLRKLKAFQAAGCAQPALLMDDIPAALPMKSQGLYRSLGEAHGHMLQRLTIDLKTAPWFCPTVYCDFFSTGGVEGDLYLSDLADTAPEAVPVFWTGKTIVPRTIVSADIRPWSRLFANRLMLWDNLYAHDYCPWKIFLGPYAGRPQGLNKQVAGVLLNPTGLVEVDKIYLDQLAAWRSGEPIQSAWRKAMARAGVPKGLLKLVGYLNLPQTPIAAKALTPKAIAKARSWLKPLIWNWKSPLQRELYPYLFMLDADLRLAEAQPLDPAWVRKRFTPIVAETLLAGALRNRSQKNTQTIKRQP
jgi:hyaluronoglucosaminidase